MATTQKLFLGLDLSTQGLKAIVLSEEGKVTCDCGINFDKDLPKYGTDSGALRDTSDGGLTVTAPTLMFVEALELVLSKLQQAGVPMGQIVAISSSGQQHGSTYWAKGGRALLRGLSPALSLTEQLRGAFSLANGPIWMDSSTAQDCASMEKAVGGAQAMADLTGSRAYERFTGTQIRKLIRSNLAAYDATERISLVSSFVASLLIGDYAPIDGSDACGMNLLDIKKKDWSPACLRACADAGDVDAAGVSARADGLRVKLGPVVWSHATVGRVSPFMQRYGFNAACSVIASTGDNPSTVAGLMSQPGDVVVSMGTSDTVLAILPAASMRPSGEEGHLFRNPVDPDTAMAMLCYKNGSVARERARKEAKIASWDDYNDLLRATPAGNQGRLGVYYFEPEITPKCNKKGVFRFDASGNAVKSFSQGVEARAVVEAQFMSMRLHSRAIGLDKPTRVVATGGASVNPSLLQILASVFNTPVYTSETGPNTASLGACYRAMQGYFAALYGEPSPLNSLVQSGAKLIAQPVAADARVYEALLPKYAAAEKRVLAQQNGPGSKL